MTICFSCSLSAQGNVETAKMAKLRIGNCLTELEASTAAAPDYDVNEFTCKSADDVTIIIKPHDLKWDGKKKYSLKAVGLTEKFSATVDKKNILTIILTKPLGKTDEVKYQLISEDGKNCYTLLISLKKKEDKPILPDLDLGVYQYSSDPCAGCKTNSAYYVTYDFGANTVTYPVDKYPKVGESMELVVANVNPYKYDVTITDEAINIHSASSAFLDAAFDPSKTKIVSKDGNQPEIDDVLDVLDKKISERITAYQKEGDCFNPCADIVAVIPLIKAYITKVLSYDGTVALETFLAAKVDSKFPNDSTDEKVIAERKRLLDIIVKYTKFSHSPGGNIRYLIPQIKKVDQYIFTVSATPKENVYTSRRLVNQPVKVDIVGGLRADVTSGLFVTWLMDDKYNLSPVDSIAVAGSDPVQYNKRRKIVKEDNGKLDFGVGALFHFYKKCSPDVNFALSLGAGMTVSEKPKLRYLLGGSVLVGRTNRLALTGGFAMGMAEELSDRYRGMYNDDGDLYTNGSDATVDMKKSFKTKPFIALSYSIPIFDKKEEVKADTPEAAESKEEEK